MQATNIKSRIKSENFPVNNSFNEFGKSMQNQFISVSQKSPNKMRNSQNIMVSKSTTMSSHFFSPKQQIEKEEELLPISDLDELQKLKRIFLLYTGNEKKLHSYKFIKLLSDAKILDKNFDSKYADILFFTASRSNMHIDFKGFCEIILKISEIKFPNDFIKKQSQALNKLFDNFLFPLLENIYSELRNEKLNKKCQLFEYANYICRINTGINSQLIDKHFYLIYKIYQKYFPWEVLNISTLQKSKLSEKSFMKLCRNFQICPNKISLVKLNEIYENCQINSKLILKEFLHICEIYPNVQNQGSYFSLFHLILALYLTSVNDMLTNSDKYINEADYFIQEEDASK